MTVQSVLAVAASDHDGLVSIGNVMQSFKCHKSVQAARIISVAQEFEADGALSLLIADPNEPHLVLPYLAPVDMTLRYVPVIGDYLVMYGNDYVAISPKDAFETGYNKEVVAMGKVPAEHIENMVSSLVFRFERVSETTVTGCWAFLPNGFKVAYGESACVDPNEYDPIKGELYAKERCVQAARNKLWELEGYLLKNTGFISAQEAAIPECPQSGFTAYQSKPTVRFAYEVRSDDFCKAEGACTSSIMIDGEQVTFKHYELVKAGDFIVFLNDKDVYHCTRNVFLERNYA